MRTRINKIVPGIKNIFFEITGIKPRLIETTISGKSANGPAGLLFPIMELRIRGDAPSKKTFAFFLLIDNKPIIKKGSSI